MSIITPDTISFIARITEAKLRERMAAEVLTQIGGLGPDGRPPQGVTCNVTRGPDCVGGYQIEVRGLMPRRRHLAGPEGE